jgi:glc operon protein GlcG
MHQKKYLSAEEATKIIAAIREAMEKEGKNAAIAVADPHGELIAFLRLDGCPLPSINNAINKAFTAARDGKESKVIGEASRKDGFPMTNYGDLRYTGWGGGIPVINEGEILGAIGVSGLPESEDMEYARLGIKALGY